MIFDDGKYEKVSIIIFILKKKKKNNELQKLFTKHQSSLNLINARVIIIYFIMLWDLFEWHDIGKQKIAFKLH